MALFLTGVINDGARTANGPRESRFHQAQKEGSERHGGRQRQTEVCGGDLGLSLRVGNGSRPRRVSEQGTESLSATVGCSGSAARGTGPDENLTPGDRYGTTALLTEGEV